MNETEKRIVPLKQGVNIITGDSKTGKSALIEIIDYCLCSSTSTIPKGIITEFTDLYCIMLIIKNTCYVVARQSNAKTGKMYLSREPENFDPSKLNLLYFSDKTMHSVNEVKIQIENALGLNVPNIQTEDDTKSEKASLRHMVSYLFQHQNLMASKFALIYRFTDFYKRKSVIQQFPVFAGLVDQRYYSKLIQMAELKGKLKKLKKDEITSKKTKDKAKALISPLMENYFALLNQPFDSSISLAKMIKLAQNLPKFDENTIFDNSGIRERYNVLNQRLESLRERESDIEEKITDITQANNSGAGFIEVLKELKEKTETSAIDTDASYKCPLCGGGCPDIQEIDKELQKSSAWLDNELKITSQYTVAFEEDIRKLTSQKDSIIAEIKKVWKEIKDIEKTYFNSKEVKNKIDQIKYTEVQIYFHVDVFKSGIFEQIEEDVQEIQNKIDSLQLEIDGFDLETAKIKAQAFISENMNKLAKTLDFEDEYRPLNLNFDLIKETFDIYHQRNHEKIYLYEMGSGANWVSTHIVLFLSFLRYFSKNPTSPMLSIMFFDQPSQVYFPNSTDVKESKDISAVNLMYKTIFDEINAIGNDYGDLPQIIIADHVTGSELGIKDEFNSYVRCDWRNGRHLI